MVEVRTINEVIDEETLRQLMRNVIAEDIEQKGGDGSKFPFVMNIKKKLARAARKMLAERALEYTDAEYIDFFGATGKEEIRDEEHDSFRERIGRMMEPRNEATYLYDELGRSRDPWFYACKQDDGHLLIRFVGREIRWLVYFPEFDDNGSIWVAYGRAWLDYRGGRLVLVLGEFIGDERSSLPKSNEEGGVTVELDGVVSTFLAWPLPVIDEREWYGEIYEDWLMRNEDNGCPF